MIEMKASSIILPVFIILLVLVLLVATDVIRISYCNPSLGIPCKGVQEKAPQKNDTNDTTVPQTTIPLEENKEVEVPQTTLPEEPQEKTAQPEEKPATGNKNIGYVPVSCPAIEDIKKEIEDANYCTAEKDCFVIFLGCPFGCGGYVNAKTDIPALKAKIANYNECMDVNCVDKCVPLSEPACVDNKCIGKY